MKQSFLMFAAVLVITSFSLTSCNKEEIITPTPNGEITEQTDEANEIMTFITSFNDNAKLITQTSQQYNHSQLREIRDRLEESDIPTFQAIMKANFAMPTTTWVKLENKRLALINHNESDKITEAITINEVRILVNNGALDLSYIELVSGNKLTEGTSCSNAVLKGMKESVAFAIDEDTGIIKATIRYVELLMKVSSGDC